MTVFSCFLVGNEPLTVECGMRLLEAGHRIAAVATTRDRVAEWAGGAGLEVFDGAVGLAESDETVDWLFSVANLEMIPGEVLARARAGAINFHDGPLPRYAGLNAPVWAILGGETVHGITWHLMEEGADTGDILVSREVGIAPDETAFTLNAQCFAAGVESFDAVLDEIAHGLPGRRAQDLTVRSYFGRAHRPEGAGQIDPAATAGDIARMVRALDHAVYDNPVASPWLMTGSGPVLVGEATEAASPGELGTVLAVDADTLTIAVADGELQLSRLTDLMGAALNPSDLVAPGDRLPEAGEALDEALAETAKNEAYWRARLSDYRPADWPARAGEGGRHAVALTLPEGADSVQTAAAFGAVIAASAGGEPVDLAMAAGGAGTPVTAPWAPVRFDAEASWAGAAKWLADELQAIDENSPFAADLPARIADLGARRLPMAGLSYGPALPGVPLVLVLDGDAPRLEADTSRIAAAEVELIAQRLEALLAALPGVAPETGFAALPLLPEAERFRVIEAFNRTDTEFPSDLCIHQAFEAQARETPEATALIFEAEALTYAELNAKANRLSHVLISMGVGPGKPVGLHMTRSKGLVIAALAILKAGGAYVPLDPEYPADRFAFYAADSKARVIVSESGLSDAIVPEGATRILADSDHRIGAAPATNPETGVAGADLAYLIYTSGSTGTPKGVMIEHRNVQNFFTGMDDRIDHEAGGVWLSVTSLSFDISVLELFWTLARGFKVVLLGDEKFVASGAETGRVAGGMDFSLFYWGNDDGVGRDKYRLLLEGAKFADENGFQAIWTPERHFHAFGGLYPNPSVTGAAVAAITRNIGVRAGSCVAPLHHPARIAEEWAVIDNLTNGRAGLAFASGWQPDDFVLRPENTPPNNKPAMMQAIEDVRKLWRGEELTMIKGDGSEVARLTQPRPVSKELPVWVTTAGNPETWRQAGEIGANVLTHLLGQTVAEVGEKIEIYHAALREAGHDPKVFTVTLMLHTFIADDREEAREIARGPMKAYLKAAANLIKQYAWAFPAFKKPEGAATHRDLNLTTLTEEELDDILEFAFLRYFETSGLFGTVEDALDRVVEVKAIGVTEVACLVDYGIERQTILDGLKHLSEVRARANVVADDDDFSIAAQITRHHVTHLQCTPYMARMLVENDEARNALAEVKHLMIGGEAMPAALVADLQKATSASIENMYGPTETTIWSSTGPGSAEDPTAPVGTPIANTQLYVLNDDMQPLGVGQTGQLWIGGEGVARGYWERPDLTCEKFVANPFHEGRMFGTGDLARWRADGTLDFLGRADNQIKIRGYRIEIGEIETEMEKVDGVTQAVAVMRPDASGVGQIYGYLTGTADAAEVRRALLNRLPDFMVPTRIVTLETFPLTPNRKIDRKALPDPSAAVKPVPELAAVKEAPTDGPVEIDTMAAIWRRVLNVASIQPSDNFFDLGGHSLLAIEVHRAMKAELGLKGLSIADIFRAPTLGGLHAVLSAKSSGKSRQAPQKAALAESPPPSATAPDTRPVEENALVSRRRAMRANRSAGA